MGDDNLEDPVYEIRWCIGVAFRNWILAVPSLAMAIVGTAAVALMDPWPLTNGLFRGSPFAIPAQPFGLADASFYIEWATVALIAALVGIVIEAATYLGADDAMNNRPIELPRLLTSGLSFVGTFVLFGLVCGGAALVVFAVVFGLTVLTKGVLAILLFPAMLCAGVAAAFGLVFTVPAMVFGRQTATGAIGLSWRLAFANVARILPTVIGLIIVSFIAGLIGLLLLNIPYAGEVASLVISAFLGVFQAVVITKVYRELTSPAPPQSLADAS